MDNRDDSVRHTNDVGLKDFKFGVTGILIAAGLAILFAIIS